MCLTNDIFLRVKVLQNYDLNLIVAILKGTGPKKKRQTRIQISNIQNILIRIW